MTIDTRLAFVTEAIQANEEQAHRCEETAKECARCGQQPAAEVFSRAAVTHHNAVAMFTHLLTAPATP